MSRPGIAGLLGAGAVAMLPALLHNCDDVLRAMNPSLRTIAREEGPAIRKLAEEEAQLALRDAERREAARRAARPDGIARSPVGQFDESSTRTSVGTRELRPPPGPVMHSALQSADSWKPLGGETIEHVPALGVQTPDARFVNRPHLLAAFPTDDSEYEKVYRSVPTAAASAEIARLSRQLAGAGSHAKWTKYPPTADFRDSLRNLTDVDLVVIVAHAEDAGATIVLPSGHRMSYLEVHLTCGDMQVKCVVLSCHSPDLSLTSEVSTVDAIAMWSSASRTWALSRAAMDADTFVRSLREARVELQHRRQILLTTVVVASAIGGTTGYELVASRQR